MASNRIEQIQVLFQKRNARSRGPTVSNDLNASMDELVHDLASLSEQWNNRLLPLSATIPNGSDSSDIDAFANGLSGRHLYVSAIATASVDASYFNTTQSRPNTIFEQFTNVYTNITNLETSLSAQISATIPIASQIKISDTGSLYVATEVESALAEVMTKANTIASFGAVGQNILPTNDNTYTIGNASLRFQGLSVGPSSLHVISKSTDTGLGPQNKSYALGVSTDSDFTSGRFTIKDSSSLIASLDTTSGLYVDGNLHITGGITFEDSMSVRTLPPYANNAAATSGGLVAGDFYRTGADPDVVCVVH